MRIGIASAVLALLLVAAGCGGHSSQSVKRKADDHRLRRLDGRRNRNRGLKRHLHALGAPCLRIAHAQGHADVEFGPSGVRGQALARDGSLDDDFLLEGSPNVLHVFNASSGAAAASPAIGRTPRIALERLFPG